MFNREHNLNFNKRFYSTFSTVRKNKLFNFSKSLLFKLPGIFFLTGMWFTAYSYVLLYMVSNSERVIESDDFKDNCNHLVKQEDEFEILGKQGKSFLSAKIVTHKETGKSYVQKGARSHADLVKEFMYANFLHAIRKDQPESLVLQTKTEKGIRFYTLSEKFENTQDLEDFVREGRTHELYEKEIMGLEATLAADQIIGKQSDCKLANLVVRDMDGKLIFLTIDHELAISPFYHFMDLNESRFPTESEELINAIRDLKNIIRVRLPIAVRDLDPKNNTYAGIAFGHDPHVREFGMAALDVMDKNKIKEFYNEVSNANIEPIINDCHQLAKHSRLFKSTECDAYKNIFNEIKNGAREAANKM